jgi:tripartite-type tricarboxylate transporter receptor subunit TctC
MTHLLRCLAASVGLLTGFAAAAQGVYPAKPIRVIVPYAPGGVGDLIGRSIGVKLTEAWQHQVLIDNRPGA